MVKEGIDATTAAEHERFRFSQPPQLEYYGYVLIFQHVQRHRSLYRAVLGRKGSAAITGRVQEYIIEHFLGEAGISSSFTDFSVPPKVLAQIVIGALLRTVLWWLETPNSYSPEQMGAMVYEAIHHRPAPGERGKPAAGHRSARG